MVYSQTTKKINLDKKAAVIFNQLHGKESTATFKITTNLEPTRSRFLKTELIKISWLAAVMLVLQFLLYKALNNNLIKF